MNNVGMKMDLQKRFSELYAKIEHFNQATQLKQVYEWVKTGHINLAEFKVLITKITVE